MITRRGFLSSLATTIAGVMVGARALNIGAGSPLDRSAFNLGLPKYRTLSYLTRKSYLAKSYARLYQSAPYLCMMLSQPYVQPFPGDPVNVLHNCQYNDQGVLVHI